MGIAVRAAGPSEGVARDVTVHPAVTVSRTTSTIRSDRDKIMTFLSMPILIKLIYHTSFREQNAVKLPCVENRFLGIFHHGPSGGEMLIMLPGTVPNETKGSLFTQVMCWF
jgi:hypothetical protein